LVKINLAEQEVGMSKYSKLLTFFVAFFISTSAFAEFILLQQKDGAAFFGFLGRAVAGAGDVDGDGKADFIVGAPEEFTDAGSAFVYSGATGALLYQKDGPDSLSYFGFSVAGAGDVNADGKADFIVGAFMAAPDGLGNAGAAFVYSGADGSLLYQKNGAEFGAQLGISVAGAGDVNGDGKDDFIIGAWLADAPASNTGAAYVYSGATGTLLYQKNGAFFDNLGISVSGAGDANGDGRADFLVGAFHANSGNGAAYLYSGATGALLYQKDGSGLFGASVSGAGDADGDGKADFFIGAPNALPGGLAAAGSTYLYSGATGALLYQKNGAAIGDHLGYQVAGAGDVDGDGKADFIVGAPQANPGGLADAGSAYLYSGADGSLIFQKHGTVTGDYLGLSVSGAGDLNGNGIADFIIGAALADPGGILSAGSALVYSLCSGRGDMNLDGSLTSSDIVLILNCTFLGTGNCDNCFADVNCDGVLTSSDVVLELNRVFLGLTAPPWCGS
jgi:hypothetical protein